MLDPARRNRVTGIEPVPRVQLADQIVERLREAIERGQYQAGETLPAEGRLATELGVGRSTLRDALRMLGHLGFVKTRHGSGTVVIGVPTGTGDRSVGPPVAELKDLFDARLVLEVEIAQQAAARRSAEQLEYLVAVSDQLRGASSRNDVNATADMDARFHEAVALASNNRYLIQLHRALQPAVVAAAGVLLDMQAPERIEDLHDDLVAAIEARDVRAAAAATRRTYDEIYLRLTLIRDDS